MGRDLSTEIKHQLVEALLECFSMRERESRNSIVDNLSQVRNRIQRSSIDYNDVHHIVDRVLDFEDGFATLLNAIRLYEGDSSPMRSVEALYKQHANEIEDIIGPDTPNVPHEEWIQYLDSSKAKLIASSSLDPFVSDLGLQKLFGLESNKATDEAVDIEQVIIDFVEQKEYEHGGVSQVLYIEGHGGYGKSTLARGSVLAMLEYFDEYRTNQIGQPINAIPIFVDLKKYYIDHEDLDVHIVSKCLCFHNVSTDILRDTSLEWVIFFDAADEVHTDTKSRVSINIVLERFLNDYLNIRVVVLSRLDTLKQVQSRNPGQIYKIQPLNRRQINNRLAEANIDEVTATALIALLKDDESLLQLLQIPRLLDACIVGCQHEMSISLVKVLQLTIDAHRKHEEQQLLDSSEETQYDRGLRELAELYWDEPFISNEIFEKKFFYVRYLSSGLCTKESDVQYKFSSTYIPEYLLVQRLRHEKRYQDENIGLLHEEPERFVNIIRLWADLCQEQEKFTEVIKLLPAQERPDLVISAYLDRSDLYYIVDTGPLIIALESLNLDEKYPIQEWLKQLLQRTQQKLLKKIVKILLSNDELLHYIEPAFVSNLWETERLLRWELWPLYRHIKNLPPEELIEQIASMHEPYSNQEFILLLLEDSALNWSEGCPEKLFILFDFEFDDHIVSKILDQVGGVESFITSLIYLDSLENHELLDKAIQNLSMRWDLLGRLKSEKEFINNLFEQSKNGQLREILWPLYKIVNEPYKIVERLVSLPDPEEYKYFVLELLRTDYMSVLKDLFTLTNRLSEKISEGTPVESANESTLTTSEDEPTTSVDLISLSPLEAIFEK